MTQAADEFRLGAVRPALEAIGLWSPVAEELVVGTAAHESGGFRYRGQVGAHGQPAGPALGLCQIEPATHDDLYRNWLDYRPELRALVVGLKTAPDADPLEEVRSNDRYAAAICRLIYRRHPNPLPQDPADVEAIAALWKAVYNTAQGKGTVDQFVADYHRYVA